MTQDLVIREGQVFAQLEEIGGFPPGSISLIGLKLTDPEMTYDQWEGIGRILGHMHRLSAWMLGDWINSGDKIFGQEAAQATEGHIADRYNVAERVTGLAHGTLKNYASHCGKIEPDVRRVELPFRTHEPVSPLEREQQIFWLQQAIDNGWTRDDLADAIAGRTIDAGGGDGDDDGDGDSGSVVMTVGERIEEAARLVWRQASATENGDWLVPNGPMNQLAGALGEE